MKVDFERIFLVDWALQGDFQVDTVLIVIFVLFGLGIVGYFFLMMFYPEWVGITGSDTKKELELEMRELEKRKAEEEAQKKNS